MWYCNNKNCSFTATVNTHGCICSDCYHILSREPSPKADPLKLTFRQVVRGEHCGLAYIQNFSVVAVIVRNKSVLNLRLAIIEGNPYSNKSPRVVHHKKLNTLQAAKAYAQEVVYSHFISMAASS